MNSGSDVAAAKMPPAPLPLTIVTGFLGAGIEQFAA